jgi:uncharacterized phage-like protein YoqJ
MSALGEEFVAVAFTGHRPPRLPLDAYPSVYLATLGFLRELKPAWAICGMARGYDLLAAEVCIALGIPYIAAIPYPDQAERWTPMDRMTWELLKHLAGRVIILSQAYAPRNKWMVDNCDHLLACWDGAIGGGTASTVAYARLRGKHVTVFAPARESRVAE